MIDNIKYRKIISKLSHRSRVKSDTPVLEESKAKCHGRPRLRGGEGWQNRDISLCS
jgi:hypothetical protein